MPTSMSLYNIIAADSVIEKNIYISKLYNIRIQH